VNGADPATFRVVAIGQVAGINNIIGSDGTHCFDVSFSRQGVVSRFERPEDFAIPGCDPKGLKDL
jgi:hypothetical protein